MTGLSSGLALPPNPIESNEKETAETSAVETMTDAETSDLDAVMQSDEFRNMIGEETFTDPTLDELFPLPVATFDNPIQIPAAGNAQLPSFRPRMPTPPLMEPNAWAGPRYHPDVGWYYPAQPASGLSTPMYPPPMISEGYTPASSLPPSLMSSAMPSGATTPTHSVNPSKSKNRRKYGPAAFLEDQARSRVEASRAVDDLPPPSASLQAKKRDPHPLRDRKHPNIVQNCVCSDKEALKIKRPKNAFIIYRSTVSRDIINRLGRNDNQSVSRIAGQMWKDIKDTEEGKKFFRLAAEEAERHSMLYPDYKYKPGQSARNKFGSASCTCGAYRANLKALRETEGYVSDYDEQHDHDEFSDDDTLFVPPVSSRPAVRAAHERAARAKAAQAAIPDLASLGLPASQQAGAQAHIDAMKRKRDAAEALDDSADEPLSKRRSARNSAKDVNYAVPSEEDIFLPSTPTGGRKAPPSQVGGLTSSPTMSQAGISADSPARNTRSASLSRASPDSIIPESAFPFDFDECLGFTSSDNLDWEKVFANSGLKDFVAQDEAAAANDGENITVARPRSRGRSSTSQPSPTAMMVTRSKKNSIEELVEQEKTKPRRSTRKSK